MAVLWQMPHVGSVPVGGPAGPNYNGVGTGVGVPYRPVTLPAQNPSGIIQIPRSANQGNALTSAWQTNTGNQGQANQTLADFTKNYLAQKPQQQAYTDSDTGAISKFYGSGPDSVSGHLAAIEQHRVNAIDQTTAGAVRKAALANTMRRMGSGNNSANDRLYAQQLMGIHADAAQQKAANDSSNYKYVAGNQVQLAGARQKLLSDLAMRDLTPLDAAQTYEGRGLQNLGSLSNLENSNTIYDDTALRRQQLLNELATPMPGSSSQPAPLPSISSLQPWVPQKTLAAPYLSRGGYPQRYGNVYNGTNNLYPI